MLRLLWYAFISKVSFRIARILQEFLFQMQSLAQLFLIITAAAAQLRKMTRVSSAMVLIMPNAEFLFSGSLLQSAEWHRYFSKSLRSPNAWAGAVQHVGLTNENQISPSQSASSIRANPKISSLSAKSGWRKTTSTSLEFYDHLPLASTHAPGADGVRTVVLSQPNIQNQRSQRIVWNQTPSIGTRMFGL